MDDARDDAVTGVVAHGLLNSVAAITGSLSMVFGTRLAEDEVQDLLRVAYDQARFLGGLLGDLVHALPPEVRMALSTRD